MPCFLYVQTTNLKEKEKELRELQEKLGVDGEEPEPVKKQRI
jgi:hypothetical protein